MIGAKTGHMWLAAALLAAILHVHPTQADKYVEAFSKVPWQTYPGGRYKASTNATLTASTIAGNLVELKPGGMREVHWHDVAEWAMVIDGTCMATVMDAGAIHPVDTWNFTAGDVWYFPRNLAHAIVGLAPTGCTFVSGFNSPSFDELTSFSASSWLATVPVDTLAQSLGITKQAAEQVLHRVNSPDTNPTFIPRGNVKELLADTASLPVQQWPKSIHRFPLLQNTPEVTNDDGSFINMVDVTRFPVSTDMSGALVRIAPGGLRQLHWHLGFNEWQFVINGTLEAGVFVAPGDNSTAVIGAGDLGFAPRGSGHYLRNIGKEDSYVVLIFDAGLFDDVEVSNFLGAIPPSWVAASLNMDTAAARRFNYKLAGFAAAPAAAKPSGRVSQERSSGAKAPPAHIPARRALAPRNV